MSVFVDASVLVSISAGEADGDALAAALKRAEAPFTSAVAIWEAAVALNKRHRMGLDEARTILRRLIEHRGIAIVPIAAADAELALDAFERFGKGRHPARLNMGDCFAWACAKAHGATLLYKGNDFALTDLA